MTLPIPYKASLLALALGFSGFAAATPALQPKCAMPYLSAPANGSGVMLDEDCKTIYVLPPVHGTATLNSVAPTSNLNLCPAVLQVGPVASNTMSSADMIAQKTARMIADFQPLDKAREELAKDAGEKQAEATSAQSASDLAQSKVGSLFAAIENANNNFRNCTVSSADAATACATQKVEVESSKAAYTAFVDGTLTPAQEAYNKARLASDKANSALSIANSRWTDAISPALALQNQMMDLNLRILDLYRQYTPLEGATAQLVYSVAWDKLVQSYRMANPSLAVNWQKMPVKSANFFAVTKTRANGTDTSLPGILSSTIAGMEATGPSPVTSTSSTIYNPSGTPPYGSSPVPPLTYGQTSTTLTQRGISFGDGVSAQVVLSLAGACPFFPQGLATPAVNIPADTVGAYLSPNLEINYEVAARRGYTASYNLASFVTHLENSVRRGGFLVAKNIKDSTDDQASQDWFKIKFDSQAAEFQYTAAEQKEISQEVRQSLAERALRQVGSINTINTAPAEVPTGTVSGAANLGNTIKASCGFNFYCRASSYFLGTLDSVFSRNKAVNNFKKVNNSWSEDRVEGMQILDRSTLVTFGK